MLQQYKKMNLPKKEDILVRKMNIMDKFGHSYLFDQCFAKKRVICFTNGL